MKKILQNSLFFILGFIPFCSVAKAEIVASPVWVGRSEVVIRLSDEVELRTTTIPVGKKYQYKTLTVEVKACLMRLPITESVDSAAFVEVVDTHPDTPHFTGWMFQQGSYLSGYRNLYHGVEVVQCSGNPVTSNLKVPKSPLEHFLESP